jgi:hypothetical protein
MSNFNKDKDLAIKQILKNSGYTLVMRETSSPDVIKFYSPDIKDRNGEFFFFYFFTNKINGIYYLGDGGFLLETLKKSGLEINLGLFQKLLSSYGLIFTDNYCVLEGNQNFSCRSRINNLLQGFIATDASIRSLNFAS